MVKKTTLALVAGGTIAVGAAAYFLLQAQGIIPPPPPAQKGEITLTMGGATSYPGIAELNCHVKNTDTVTHNYAIMAVIGSEANGHWWGPLTSVNPSFYRDGFPVCEVGNAYDEWWSNAFICTGPLEAGEVYNVTRKIQISQVAEIKDALAAIYEKTDAAPSKAYAAQVLNNVITVSAGAAEVSGMVASLATATEVDIQATIQNTGNVEAKFALLMCAGDHNADPDGPVVSWWFGPGPLQAGRAGYYIDDLPICSVNNPYLDPVTGEHDTWYDNAFTCVTIPVGGSATVKRKINVANFDAAMLSHIKDAIVMVAEPTDIRIVYAWEEQNDILHLELPPPPPPPPEIKAEIVSMTVTVI